MSQAANSWEGPTYIEDVFSTYLYTGTGATLTITNGIDLAGEGGLVWLKSRNQAYDHTQIDTVRGSNKVLYSNATVAEATNSNVISAFTSSGFTVPGTSTYSGQNGTTYASWTFRKAPRFFDVVTYTGNGVAGRTVSHNLGVEPGCIIIKQLNDVTNWLTYHRSNTASPETDYLQLNSTAATIDLNNVWNDTAPTSTEFTLGINADVNNNGGSYVAYLFAHDPLGPSGDGSDGLIACGSYTGNGSTTGPVIDLGWEPQWVMIKRTDTGGAGYDWFMFDAMRGMPVGGADVYLDANSSDAETGPSERFKITPTGFQMATTSGSFNDSGGNYIYIAIRRGPMREPTSGTEVFSAVATTAATDTKITTDFPVDWQVLKDSRTGSNGPYAMTRLTGVSTVATDQNGGYLRTDLTNAEATASVTRGWDNVGYKLSAPFGGNNSIYYNFRRAPGFFDVVAYTGDGVAGRTVSHNLGVAPEMIILKGRNYITDWAAYHASLGNTKYLIPNTTAAAGTSSLWWNNTSPTASQFTLGNSSRVNNTSSNTYIAYLFATLAGVSKVGSYTGNGTSQTINCGFTGGARFVIIKRTDSTGDWYVWDTARGIVSGNDPHLSLNTTAAEVTTNDTIDPDSSGFIVNQVAATNVNVSSASYIYLAIA